MAYAVVGAQVAIAAVGSFHRHFHLEAFATPAHRAACKSNKTHIFRDRLISFPSRRPTNFQQRVI